MLGFASRHPYFAEDERFAIVQRLKVLWHHVRVFDREREGFLEKSDHPEGAERIDDVAR